jgi:hypothetical protein
VKKMLFGILCFAAGLIVGWNFLPQPLMVELLIGRWTDKLNGK